MCIVLPKTVLIIFNSYKVYVYAVLVSRALYDVYWLYDKNFFS